MNKESLISKTFDLISNVTNNRFVSIRNHDLIPHQSSMDNDIDLLIPAIFMQSLVDKLSSFGYEIYQDNNQCMYGAQPHVHLKHHTLNVHFDIVTGLYYRSIANKNIFINIDTKLTDKMLNNKIKVDTIYRNIPHPNDEIVHLVCHCIFDKNKTTDRYKDRIIELTKNIDPDIVHDLLKLIFYKASNLIFSKVINHEVEDLYESYITFKDY